MTIYIVRKHHWARGYQGPYQGAYHNAFEIYGAYKTHAEAHNVAIAKNAKAKDYIYMVRKLVVK